MAAIEVADVFRQFGPSYIEAFGARMLPSHRRAIEDIAACRTKAMGGHVYQCGDCGGHFHVYHGCRNRSCPACHTRQTGQWLEAREAELLPCPYYHLCVTVPAGLRGVFRANQAACYSLLMRAAADAARGLCADGRYLGAEPAILAVLHTWTARMDYHPHVHLLVSGGGVSGDGAAWREARHPFLIPVRALSKLVRGKVQAWLRDKRPELFEQIPHALWNENWVAWCKQWSRGTGTVLDYLGRYVHRIAITNTRILAMSNETVTFRYKDRKQSQWRTCTLTGHEFMRRFLQHVLPKGLHKVRYYGLWNPKKSARLDSARLALQLASNRARQQDPKQTGKDAAQLLARQTGAAQPDGGNTGPLCPHCKSANTQHVGHLRPSALLPNPRAAPTQNAATNK